MIMIIIIAAIILIIIKIIIIIVIIIIIEAPMCRLCGAKEEATFHILCGCSKIAATEYKKRHDVVANIVYWNLTCFLLLWQILLATIAEKPHNHLEGRLSKEKNIRTVKDLQETLKTIY